MHHNIKLQAYLGAQCHVVERMSNSLLIDITFCKIITKDIAEWPVEPCLTHHFEGEYTYQHQKTDPWVQIPLTKTWGQEGFRTMAQMKCLFVLTVMEIVQDHSGDTPYMSNNHPRQ